MKRHNEIILTREIAEAIAKTGNTEAIGTFTQIEDSAAEALAKYSGDLDLRGLTSLSDKAAEALANHSGGLYLRSDLFSLIDKAKKL